jgi:hypothetical protein
MRQGAGGFSWELMDRQDTVRFLFLSEEEEENVRYERKKKVVIDFASYSFTPPCMRSLFVALDITHKNERACYVSVYVRLKPKIGLINRP